MKRELIPDFYKNYVFNTMRVIIVFRRLIADTYIIIKILDNVSSETVFTKIQFNSIILSIRLSCLGKNSITYFKNIIDIDIDIATLMVICYATILS